MTICENRFAFVPVWALGDCVGDDDEDVGDDDGVTWQEAWDEVEEGVEDPEGVCCQHPVQGNNPAPEVKMTWWQDCVMTLWPCFWGRDDLMTRLRDDSRIAGWPDDRMSTNHVSPRTTSSEWFLGTWWRDLLWTFSDSLTLWMVFDRTLVLDSLETL